MIHYKIYKNYDIEVIDCSDFSVEKLKYDGDKKIPYYVIDESERLVGRIGLKEYSEIMDENRLIFNRQFLYVVEDGDEEPAAKKVFMDHPQISNIPVVSVEGKLLYQFETRKEGVEEYYKEYKGSCNLKRNNEKTKNDIVVVSLTSYGERLNLVYIAIKSILCQTMKPDIVVLYISEEDSGKKIEKEDELLEAGIIIKRNVEDLKSHKKYFYAVQEYPDNIIITIDDDCIYDDQTIERLYLYHLKFPQAVVCRRGRRIKKVIAELDTYNSWENYAVSSVPENAICPIGVGGILYPVGNYRKHFIDAVGIRKTALYQDDLWLKVIELIYGVKAISIDNRKTISIDGSQEKRLFDLNGNHQKNDECIKELQRYFCINICDFL